MGKSIYKLIYFPLRLGVVWLINAISLILTASFYSGLSITGDSFIEKFTTALFASLILGVVNILIRPLLLYLSLPLGFVGVFLIGLIVNGLIFLIVGNYLPNLFVDGFSGAFWGGIIFSGINTIINSFVTLTNKGSFYQNLIIKLAKKDMFKGANTKKQGLVMLEVDGLSYHHIKKAIDDGWMPNIKRMMDKKGYRLSQVECGIPSMTSSCQAGILFGDNDGIPSFRWYDKKNSKLIVSHTDAKLINSWYSNGKGLLRDGSSINNMLAGDAFSSPMTIATLKTKDEKEKKRRARDIYLIMLNPYFITNTLFLFFVDLGVELIEAFFQWLTKTTPRQNRLHNGYPLMRSAVTVFCRDVQLALVAMDILRGSPAIYTTYAGYDEVAHHSGPWTKSAFRTLRQFDNSVKRLTEVAFPHAPRPYELIILSDHGQSQGMTFKQRYGVSLKEFIESKIPKGTPISSTMGGDTGMISVSAMENELGNVQTSGVGSKTSKALLTPATKALNKGINKTEKDQDKEASLITVCGSGNLAQVYFNYTKDRVNEKEINKRYPRLIEELVGHEGVGLVIYYDENNVPMLSGKKGKINLQTGKIQGKDPLQKYGDTKLRIMQLKRLASFTGNGDLTVISTVYDDGSVAALEELIGNHGGVGGEQTDAFILHPDSIKVPQTTNSEDVFNILNKRRDIVPSNKQVNL